MAGHVSVATLLVRVLVAFGLSYALGFERQLRGSPAGDRTFSLIGTASALLGNLASFGSANAVAGAVTGIGFIGGGIVFRRSLASGEIVSGLTTAAAIFSVAALGAAAGAGLLWPAALATALILFALEAPHIPFLRVIDARRWAPRLRNDADLYGKEDDTSIVPHNSPDPPRH